MATSDFGLERKTFWERHFEKVFSLWWSQDLVPASFTALAFNGQMCSENVPSVLWNSCESPRKSSVGLFDRCSMGILTYMSDREVDSFGRGGGGRRDEAEQHLFSNISSWDFGISALGVAFLCSLFRSSQASLFHTENERRFAVAGRSHFLDTFEELRECSLGGFDALCIEATLYARLGHLHTIVYLPCRFLSFYIISVFLR